MTKSIVVLVSLSLMVAVALIASAAGQSCPDCAQGNWDPMKKLDEVGNPNEQAPTPAWGPAVVRLTNSQFSQNKTDEAANNKPAAPSTATQTPASSIDLRNASADPNPASAGSTVKIIAVLGVNPASSAADMKAYAIITNSADVRVGNVTLEHMSGDEYSGDWTARAAGSYKATIEAFASGVSKTFNDALQIDVTGSDNTNGNNHYTKLG